MPEEPNIDEIVSRKLNIGTAYIADVREQFYKPDNGQGAIIRAIIEARIEREMQAKMNSLRRCNREDLEKLQGSIEALELAKSYIHKTNP